MRETSITAERAQLLARIRLTLDAVERAGPPSATWAQMRALAEGRRATLQTLRALGREVKVLGSLLPIAEQTALATALTAAGIDVAAERAADAAAVRAIRTRGRIRTEREYRRVRAYADQIGSDRTRQDEYLALGVLLDEFVTRGAV